MRYERGYLELEFVYEVAEGVEGIEEGAAGFGSQAGGQDQNHTFLFAEYDEF